MEKIRVLLADDHGQVRSLVRARLSREPDFEIVGEVDTSAQAIRCARTARPHIVLIDPWMRDGLALVAIKQMAAQSPESAIVVLTTFSDTLLKMGLRDVGVLHILDKGIESGRLVDILRQVGRADSKRKN